MKKTALVTALLSVYVSLSGCKLPGGGCKKGGAGAPAAGGQGAPAPEVPNAPAGPVDAGLGQAPGGGFDPGVVQGNGGGAGGPFQVPQLPDRLAGVPLNKFPPPAPPAAPAAPVAGPFTTPALPTKLAGVPLDKFPKPGTAPAAPAVPTGPRVPPVTSRPAGPVIANRPQTTRPIVTPPPAVKQATRPDPRPLFFNPPPLQQTRPLLPAVGPLPKKPLEPFAGIKTLATDRDAQGALLDGFKRFKGPQDLLNPLFITRNAVLTTADYYKRKTPRLLKFLFSPGEQLLHGGKPAKVVGNEIWDEDQKVIGDVRYVGNTRVLNFTR